MKGRLLVTNCLYDFPASVPDLLSGQILLGEIKVGSKLSINDTIYCEVHAVEMHKIQDYDNLCVLNVVYLIEFKIYTLIGKEMDIISPVECSIS